MIVLSDGSVIAKSCHGGVDTTGNLWDKLTPDTNGSYVNGKWSRIAAMNDTRLYCSSQMLKDGRVYVAGGEYGEGGSTGETYDPVTDKWTMAGPLPNFYNIADGNSCMLPDGRVLQGIVVPDRATLIYDPHTNAYTFGPSTLGSHDEAAWLKLPDNSILFVDLFSRKTERYLPDQNRWVRDDSVPVQLYDRFGRETGASLLLPDGRGFFIGSPSVTAFYTPSGTDSAGVWSAGPIIPNGFGAPDAAAAMMSNGNVLCAFSKSPSLSDTFPAPTVFYEFDYRTNAFTRISAPDGGDTMAGSCYITGMVDLPDGNVLFASLASNTYYIYVPGGSQVAAGKPAITAVAKQDCNTYVATGHLFNGISFGAAYGDDWQMPTNYPIVRLWKDDDKYGRLVYYARSYNWNSTGVMRGTAVDSTWFSLPENIPDGTYNLDISANGIHSDPYLFTTCNTEREPGITLPAELFSLFPDPASVQTTAVFSATAAGACEIRIIDVLGREVWYSKTMTHPGANEVVLPLAGLDKGVYSVVLRQAGGQSCARLIVY